ncbi:lysylphosphatidylglycerol synthase transmembrane domain-containing protein [Dermatobacter hominis]|uniref:lysylphosphatidylglycerol synthase transmembrane domain-containing protein n=1 Tax=Dermatobacter hominis TaxID=2884263 RepID=UPI001D0FC334|nr:lysylphosphatidylglycerol synthase transmembrane domain-containing protein [Dermatobacter hominis]UDY36739.1 flippase-like domain-containing protein [Dermatobacter hominis]
MTDTIEDEPVTTGDAAAAPSVWSRLRTMSFGPADEHPYRRRTSDWIRVVVAIVFLAVAIPRHGDLSSFEKDLFTLLNHLPDGLKSFFRVLYALGSLWALLVVVFAAVVARRWRLARDLTIAGALAWIIARAIGALVSGSSVSDALTVTVRIGDSSPSFPMTRLAVIVAIVAAASPYLARPSRRIGFTLVVTTAIGAMYLGVGLPNAAIAAIVLGWGIAAAVHLAFGSPGGRPSIAQMTRGLHDLGIDARDVALAPTQPSGATLMTATDDHGPLAVRVLGRDAADAQVLAKMWNGFLYKSGGQRLYRTRIEEVEHEGYCVLGAERAGVRVPELVVTGITGPGAAVYVERPVTGQTLDEVGDDRLTDARLTDLWNQVAKLHGARITHGSLSPTNVVFTTDGPALRGFSHAYGVDVPVRTATAPGAHEPTEAFGASDTATLLVATADRVGPERAVRCALAGLGPTGLTPALPMIQTAVLPASMRAHGRAARKAQTESLTALRTATAAALGIEEPQLEQVHRLSWQTIAMVVGTFLGVAALLSMVGDPEEMVETLKGAEWWLLAVALAVSFSTNFASGLSLIGSVRQRVPYLRTAELQLSLSFTNLAVPAIGGLASEIRYLQKQGVDLASAATAGGVVQGAADAISTVSVFLVALYLSPVSFSFGNIDTSNVIQIALLALVAVLVATAVIFGVPKIRKKVMAPVRSAWATLADVVRSPRQVAQLLIGQTANNLLYGLVLYFCVAAFGPPVNFWAVLAANIGVSSIADSVPVPGGSTAVGSVGVAAAMTAAGATQEAAVAASLAYQLASTFIPAIAGWFCVRNLLEHDYL